MTESEERGGLRKSMPALMAGAGMMLSRMSGFVRTFFFSKYFGTFAEADAFTQASRIPNFLQNLLGDGVLAASLIPVYASMLQRREQEEADRMARAVLGLLVLITAVFVLIGTVFTPRLMPLFAWGFKDELRRDLAMHLIRIMFPGIGLLVFSAWCLAILNSHHKFFLAYVAPVAWNAAMVLALILGPHHDPSRLAIWLAWSTVVGAALQLGMQLPHVWRIMAPTWTRTKHEITAHVRQVISSSVPVFFSRGVVQVSAYIDGNIATKMPFIGASSALYYAQQLYQLPISLFGMAVSSAALPSMSAAMSEDLPGLLRDRLLGSQRAISVLVIPSMIGFLAFGDVMSALLFERGATTHADTLLIWATVAGSAVGLLSSTIARLYAAAFYAIQDTRTPMRCAVIRVAIVTVLGYLLAIVVPPMLHLTPEYARYATSGLTVSAGLAGWVEFALLRRALQARLGPVGIPLRFLGKAWLIASIAAVPATGLRWVIPAHMIIVRGIVILTAFGALYLALAHVAGLLEFGEVIRLLTRGRRRAKAT